MAFLASFEDANRPLDGTKISFADDEDAVDEATQADAIVRSALRDIFPEVIDQWSHDGNPEDTPSIVKVIAGFIMASLRYSKRYSEESVDGSSFAGRLWDHAMMLLAGLRDGTYELEGVVSGIQFTDADFWPNDKTVFEGTTKPLRFFEMEKKF